MLTFSQDERPNPWPTILVAVAVLALIGAAVFYFNPHDTAKLTLSHTTAAPTHTAFKSNSIVVDQAPAGQDDLYVFTTVRIEDHLRLPITIDTITATLTTADGDVSTTSAVVPGALPAVFGAFPQLKPLAAAPLLRETTIDPRQAAEGQVVLHFPITKAAWDARKSAILSVELYHQTPQTITIP